MPLGPFESEVLRLIAANRSPESFVGGATVLHRDPQSPRNSQDVDVFHDAEASLAESARRDVDLLRASGYSVEEGRPTATFFRAIVRRGAMCTKLEWVVDSAFRFFPVEPDLELGWRLNFWDAATNKVLAFAGRRVFRDYVDVIYLHQQHLHLGALVWAAGGKDPGLTPEWMLNWMRRTSRYTAGEIAQARLSVPPDLRAMKETLLKAAEEAEALLAKLPADELGCLYLDAHGQPVCPDPNAPEFAKLTRHFGSVKGAVARIVEE
jgi:hypothetical protein